MALLAVAGCNSNDSGDTKASPTNPPPTPSTQASTTLNSEDDARIKALDVYNRFGDLQILVSGGTPLDEAGLGRIATGRAASVIRRLATTTAEDGITIKGPIVHAPHNVVVSLTATVPTVTWEDCVDVSQRRATNKDGTPAEVVASQTRFVQAVVVTRDATAGGWRVTDVNAQRDRAC
ncbi:hypothetical protein ACFRCG_12935 [Embleya sp. NPDC056575]|uniref:hypothetical protein n=1 Tax=unclassified Embleya TaxID=2699296 RepID=UPI00367BA04F